MKLLRLLFLILGFPILFLGCQHPTRIQSSSPESTVSNLNTVTVVDASGTEIKFSRKPERIVCLHLSCFDILAELDVLPIAVHHLLHPLASSPIYFGEAGQDLISISGFGEPNLEQLLRLKPDLIIGHAAQLSSQREILKPIASLYVLEINDRQDAIDNLRAIAKILNRQTDAEKAIFRFSEKFEKYQEKSPRNQTVLVTNGTKGNFYTATDRSLLESVLAKVAQYPWSISTQVPSAINWVNFSQEKILTVNPDVIFVLVPSRSQNFQQQLRTDSFWKELKAVKEGRVYIIENHSVGGLTTGTRSLSSLLDEMMPKIYPDVFEDSSP
ncbi:ABC transporter substrate-binding protein [Lusitaniella coriacea]|uniref:ABC transporter substrate-binding protein n=1 Tax=Lusitaniella coriacea TaxID=1983105 RepID=UPI003CE89439